MFPSLFVVCLILFSGCSSGDITNDDRDNDSVPYKELAGIREFFSCVSQELDLYRSKGTITYCKCNRLECVIAANSFGISIDCKQKENEHGTQTSEQKEDCK